jgi:hypothetical protein
VYSPVGSMGASAGKIAGANAAGANQQTNGFLRAQADQILGMQIFSIGHSTTSAKEVGISIKLHDLMPFKLAEKYNTAKLFEIAKLLTDENDRIVGAQLVAKKYGSQFAWQLYKSVLAGEDRKELLKRFNSPRMKMAEALANIVKSAILVESIGEGKALTLANAASEPN